MRTKDYDYSLAGKHGMCKTPLYIVWINIKSRCYNPANKSYPRYGGRGITLCHQWMHNFKLFYDWAIKKGWRTGLQIDRRNNDGNYTPRNCRFVTKRENGLNTSVALIIPFKGKKRTAHELSEMLNIPESVIKYRHKKGIKFDLPYTKHKKQTNLLNHKTHKP